MGLMQKLSVVVALTGLMNACGADRSELASNLDSATSSGACPSNIKWVYPHIPKLTGEVLNFARSHLNQTVGGGECADLPVTALKKYGAKNFYDLGPTGLNADYVWGSLVDTVTPNAARMSRVVPGDIVQFTGANFYWSTGNGGWQSAQAAHHTAVVEAASADGKSLCVLQQNSGGKRYVTYGYYNIAGLKSGMLRVYSPIQ
jgi:hypothetical protein